MRTRIRKNIRCYLAECWHLYFDDILELPNGYYGMHLIANIPWLWFKVMNTRVLALPHINGDLSKVNILPSKRKATYEQYGQGLESI
jgi:alkane 1-monooxygenase